MVAFLPLAASDMLWLRPSNNQLGALLSSPLSEEPRIVPANAIVAAQSTVNTIRANLEAIRFDVMFVSPHEVELCVLGYFTDGCSADSYRRGLHKPRKILCLLPPGRNFADLSGRGSICEGVT